MTESDAKVCERIVREHARTFHLASAFLPPEKRRAAYALYAFCRVADDIVDRADQARLHDADDDSSVARELAAHEAKLADALAGRPSDPVFRELWRVMQSFGVPEHVLRELLDGVARDLRPVRYESWTELASYCEGVASSVGEMCTYVFGVQGGAEVRATALRYARTLGLAMQLTNILRDVGEDAQRGRCYLPLQDLAMFHLTPDDVLHDRNLARDERWKPFMAFEVGRARALYEAAMPGIPLLSPDAQRCAWACAVGYSGILGALERLDYDSIAHRARLGHWQRLGVLWRVWRAEPVRQPARALPGVAGPHLDWAPADPATAEELVRLA
ncbi:MAG: phytoene/squalene synthase family protein [Gemmatimonadaceae bacterium]|jgi:phytoene synthase|nr:phytoene/squalene synthase family protein [Gemmatimonadaceae bacterium]